MGLFFLIAMYLWSPPSKTYYSFQNPLILSIFIAICLLGIMAAIYPSLCQGLMKFQKEMEKKTSKVDNILFEGHHPDCGKFESHTFCIKGKKYCPGCSGLFIGAIIAVVGTLLYYFAGLPRIYGQTFFWMGEVMVFLALFLIVFLETEKKLKFISNIALVLGSFLILIGIMAVKENWIMEIYFLFLVIFWILTRVSVSEKYHEDICRDCQKESICIYE